MNKKILIVAAHPDDEVLGCGGTIAKHVLNKDFVHLAFMSDGVSSRSNFSKLKLKSRLKASKLAQSILGISSAYYFNFPDNKMDTIPLLNIVQKLEPIIKKLKPEIVYTHHYNDLNVDHKITYAAVMTACRPLPKLSVREIYGFEILSSTEWPSVQQLQFKPNFFVDITQHNSTKMKALKAYKEEMRARPHSRSIKHMEVISKHRGYSVGVEMAEAFEIYRIVS